VAKSVLGKLGSAERQKSNVIDIEYHYHGNESNYLNNSINISRMFDDNTVLRQKLKDFDATRKTEQVRFVRK
jgi:hypothetical protein